MSSDTTALNVGIDGAAIDAIGDKMNETSDHLNDTLDNLPDDMTIAEQVDYARMTQQLGVQTAIVINSLTANSDLMMKCANAIKIPNG